jgi:ABC-type multidrug transport system fused ATPase/permease subunit
MKTIRKLAPLFISYLVLFALSAIGPFLSTLGGTLRGNWAFLFFMPFCIGCVPYSFIAGELMQRATRSTKRAAWAMGALHFLATLVIFFVGVFDFMIEGMKPLLYALLIVPSVICGLFFVLGMRVMRAEQVHSDAKYGVEVHRHDPWASFFDLQWEGDEADNTGKKLRNRGPKSARPARLRRAEGRRKSEQAAKSDGAGA